MKRLNYKPAVMAVAYCLLPICLGCRSALLERASWQPVGEKGSGAERSELFSMPDGLFCSPPEDTGEVSEGRIVRPPFLRTFVSCKQGRQAVAPPPLVGSRQSRSRFHPVPTRPVFLPRPDRVAVVEPPVAPMPGEAPPATEQLGSPQIELILPEPPPEEIPIPRAEGTDERVTSTPSWIFRASSRLKPPAIREARSSPDSSEGSLRR